MCSLEGTGLVNCKVQIGQNRISNDSLVSEKSLVFNANSMFELAQIGQEGYF
jgi:hypothetical protein